MYKLKKYLIKYRKEAILAPTFKLIEALIDLFFPIIIALIVDNGINKSNFSYVIKMFVLLIFLSIIGTIFAIIAQYYSASVSSNVSKNYRSDLFKHFEKFTLIDIDRIGRGKIINSITNDSFQILNGINLLLRLSLRSPFIVIGSIIAAFLIDKKIGLIFLFISILILTMVIFVSKIVIPKFKKVQENKDEMYQVLNENLTGIRVIKSYNIENDLISSFNKLNKENYDKQEAIFKINSISSPLNYLIINLSIALIIYFGAYKVYNGDISQGNLIALYNYIAQILIEIVKLANLILIFPKTIASINRCEEILNEKSSFKNGKKSISDLNNVTLEFKNVSFNYSNDEKRVDNNVLNSLNFKIHSGEKIGIVGGTASGKTTMVDLIARLYDVTSGEILINDINIKDYKIKDLRELISVVNQKKYIYNRTIKENIDIENKKFDDISIDSFLEIADAKDFVYEKENGLNYILEENGKNLSEGQNKRISIARAFSKNFKILLLDDITSSLDNVTLKNVISNIKSSIDSEILLMFTQKTSLVKDLDKIIVLDKGNIVGFGTHKELLNKCNVYKEMIYTQVN